jgi:hypothetical protein
MLEAASLRFGRCTPRGFSFFAATRRANDDGRLRSAQIIKRCSSPHGGYESEPVNVTTETAAL